MSARGLRQAAAIACATLGVTACGNQVVVTAGDAASNYVYAVAEGNSAKACGYLTPAARRALVATARPRAGCSAVLTRCVPKHFRSERGDPSQLLYASTAIVTHGNRAPIVSERHPCGGRGAQRHLGPRARTLVAHLARPGRHPLPEGRTATPPSPWLSRWPSCCSRGAWRGCRWRLTPGDCWTFRAWSPSSPAGCARGPRFVREGAAMRQATRVWLPGELRAVVLYHPAQYPLARALTSVHPDAELWYAAPDPGRIDADPEAEQLRTHDRAARERATGVLAVDGAEVDDGPLRERLEALEVISSRAFVPQARLRGGWAVRKGLMRRA